MTVPIKESAILGFVELVTAVLEANYPSKYMITRDPSFDPDKVPNRWILVVFTEGASNALEGSFNQQVIYETPLVLSIRIGSATEESGDLPSLMNDAESLIMTALIGERITANGATIGHEIKGAQRDVLQTCIWEDIELSFTHPIS